MIAIQKSQRIATPSKCTPNLVPCRVHHDGPADASGRYWNPEVNWDGTTATYFRGRRLNGRLLKVPEGCKGVVIKGAKFESGTKPIERLAVVHDENQEACGYELKISEEVGEFDNMIIWGHETMAEADDVFVKGVSEWIRFAELIHAQDEAAKVEN